MVSCAVTFAQDGVIARVAGEEVTVETLSPFFESLDGEQKKALQENPALMSQAVRNVILRRLLMKEVLESGWDKRPDVAARMEQAREAVLLESYLEEVARAPDGFPSDDQIREVYQAQKEELILPRQVELAQIYIPSGENADNVQSAAADAMVEQIRKRLGKEDFADLARQFSGEKQSGSRGGTIGWLTLDALRPDVRDAVADLGKGETAGPIRMDDGYYFVKVLDVKPERTAELTEVRDRIVDLLRQQRARQNRAAYMERLQQKHPMAINELALSGLVEEKN